MHVVALFLMAGAYGLAHGASETPGIRIVEARSELVNDVYRLDARIEFQLSDAATEALDNGVPLTIELSIEVLRQRAYLWDPTIATLSQRYRLEYHALSGLYLLKNLNTGQQRSFVSRRVALAELGEVNDFPMLDRSLLKSHLRYYARLQAQLDIESLPLPLRPLAYLSSDWRMVSEWYTWPLQV